MDNEKEINKKEEIELSEHNDRDKNVKVRELTEEMEQSYLDYAMSVIVARALPDVRDGLKPVHRRILYAMSELGLRSNVKHRKSATVVGEVLGKYHPHGDIAVYDSLVRMAQNFSMRYTLVDGQGNFGCFTKDTKVKLTDNRDLNFEELIKENKKGKKNYTYTVNKLGLISIAEIINPRITKKKAEIIKVILDNGEEIKCTPNHRFLLRNGLYKEACNLNPGESLMPIYQKFSEKTDRLNREGYLLVYQNKTGQWVPAHHLADNYNLSCKIYSKSKGRVRHHIDFNKLNNDPNNITRLRWKEHWKLHFENASHLHRSKAFRDKIAAGRRKFWSFPETKINYSKRLSERNLDNWKDPNYREKMCSFLSHVNKEYIKNHPEKRLELSQRASKTFKKLWQDPYYKKLFNKKIINANKQRLTNNTGKIKFIKICRAVYGRYHLLNRELYEKSRNTIYPYSKATSWKTGFNKYFKGRKEFLYKELNFNHKVLRIEFSAQREDVYDLTIENTHNFALSSGIFVHNSMDGDSAAAMRYTEARMTKIAEELLIDIEKETVNFVDNYDSTRKEPSVLPGKIPNLLLNGTLGIAVGMATNIPTHNLIELCNGIERLIDNPEVDIEELMEDIPGPDFPTGGIIYDKSAIKQAYTTGKGSIIMRGVADIVEHKNSFQIIISEIPYQVNKADLITKIADLVRNKKIEGISDLRDESDRKEGVRIVVDLKSNSYPKKILNSLFDMTPLQSSFHVNLVALIDGIQPRLLGLKNVLEEYIKHRQKVITLKTKFDLNKAKERLHILEGLKIALDAIDAVINTIRKSPTKEEAHKQLISKFKLSDIQAQAILDMRLSALAGLERQKVEDEIKEKQDLITTLQAILNSPEKILQIIKDDLKELKEKYNQPRKTKIIPTPIGQFSAEDFIANEHVIVTLTKGNYIKRIPVGSFRAQNRGGKGIIGMDTKEEDVVDHLILTQTHDNIYFFTDKGRIFSAKVYDLPSTNRTTKGQALVNIIQLAPEEKVTAVIAINPKSITDHEYLFFATKLGTIKKTPLKAYTNIRKTGILAIKLNPDDLLKFVRLTTGNNNLLIVTKQGQAIYFAESQVRPMGRSAAGVRGIKLRTNDETISCDVVDSASESSTDLLTVLENGYGKRTVVGKHFHTQNRGGSGLRASKVNTKTGSVVEALVVSGEKGDIVIISSQGQVIRLPLKSVKRLGRDTMGVTLMRMKGGDKVSSVGLIKEEEIEKDIAKVETVKIEEPTTDKDETIITEETNQNEIVQIENNSEEEISQKDFKEEKKTEKEDKKVVKNDKKKVIEASPKNHSKVAKNKSPEKVTITKKSSEVNWWGKSTYKG